LIILLDAEDVMARRQRMIESMDVALVACEPSGHDEVDARDERDSMTILAASTVVVVVAAVRIAAALRAHEALDLDVYLAAISLLIGFGLAVLEFGREIRSGRRGSSRALIHRA
jgi:hypothetical protein